MLDQQITFIDFRNSKSPRKRFFFVHLCQVFRNLIDVFQAFSVFSKRTISSNWRITIKTERNNKSHNLIQAFCSRLGHKSSKSVQCTICFGLPEKRTFFCAPCVNFYSPFLNLAVFQDDLKGKLRSKDISLVTIGTKTLMVTSTQEIYTSPVSLLPGKFLLI